MGKTYLDYSPRQADLLPRSPLEWLPKDHLAYFVLDIVQELDLTPIFAHYERELRGHPPYHPRLMVGLLLYAYCVGLPASRKIERKTYEDVGFRVIAGGQHPDHTAISEFRRIHLQALTGLFIQVLALCQKAGLVKLGVVAIDGTKVKANASKHKAMSYDRMKIKQAELEEKVAGLLAAAERADAEDDATYGKNRRGDELPEDLRHAETRLAKIREAKAALEAEARQQAEERRKPPEDPPPDAPAEVPTHKIPVDAEGMPTPKAQRNFTDPESRIQKGADGFVQGYNCQAAVDGQSQIVVAQLLTNQPPDSEHLVPVLEQVIENCGDVPTATVADAGYFSENNVARCERLGTSPYIAPGRTKEGEARPTVRGRTPANLTPKQRMRRRLTTKVGAAIYARRKTIVEPVFGQVKQARGIRQFLLRGLTKVRGEWALICLTHNLLKLHMSGKPA